MVHRFKYLGSWITTDGRDDLDVDERIAAAGKQFGALRKCLFASADITPQAKHVVYTTLVLNALLYGGESWCLPEHLHRRLHRFHMDCVRVMCRINRWHTRRQHIRNEHLLNHLQLLPIRSYIDHRQLRWLGHVARMGHERLPRKFLACWCPHARPVGRPLLPYGESVTNALKRAAIDPGAWHAVALNKDAWRDEIRDLIDPGYRDRTAAAKAAIDARRSRRANARARYRPQPQRRRQISDDENPNHFVFGHGWLPKEGCKICIECRQRNDPVGLALDIAHNRARHYADEVLQAAGAPTSPGGRYLLPAGFPSPTPS